MTAGIHYEGHKVENIRCLHCGKPAAFDICEECALKMEDPAVRQKIYDLRYSTYAIDHGSVDCDFLDRFVTSGLAVLELGAGAGHLSARCKNLTDKVVTTDFSVAMAHTAKSHYPYLEVCIADAEKNLPFKDGSFDIVISSEFLEHLYDVHHHLSEVYRILKSDGLYIIKTPNKTVESIYNRLSRNSNYYQRSFHPSIKSYLSLKAILTTHGYDPIFIPSRRLSASQKDKIPSGFVTSIIEGCLHYAPIWIQPSLICAAKKT